MTDESLLRALLEAWRSTHDVALEPLIEAVGARVAWRRGPVAARKEVAWHAIAATADAADVSRLLAGRWPTGAKAGRARVAALVRFEPDPRITRGVGVIAPLRTSDTDRALLVEIAALMARAPTAAIERTIADLEVGSVYAWLFADARRALDQLRRTRADPELLAAARANAPPNATAIAAAWHRHFDAPGDLANRAVLAEELDAAGDPRGELIAAQLAIAEGRGTPKLIKPVEELLVANIQEWMGRLPCVWSDDLIFERGFLMHARCVHKTVSALVRSADEPAWTTVEKLEVVGMIAGDLAPLLSRLPSLRALRIDREMALHLDPASGFPSIRVVDVSHGAWWPPREAFPNLEILGGVWEIRDDAIAEEVATRSAQRGVTLVYMHPEPGDIARIMKARARGPAELRLAHWFPFGKVESWCFRVHRDDGIVHGSWTGAKTDRTADTDGAAALTELAASGMTHLRLFLPPRTKLPSVEAVLAKLAGRVAISRDGAPSDPFAAPP